MTGFLASRVSLLRVVAVAMCLLVSLLSFWAIAPPAQAWKRLYCKAGFTSIKYFLSTNYSPQTDLEGGVELWEPAPEVTLTRTTVEADRDVYVNNKNFGATGWVGLTHDADNLEDRPACNVYGKFIRARITVSVNNYYNSTTSPPDHPYWRRGTATHEFGHYLGLDHESAIVSCPNGGSGALSIMYPSTWMFSSDCPFSGPRPDDFAGIAAIY